jgi:hypothetical protein
MSRDRELSNEFAGREVNQMWKEPVNVHLESWRLPYGAGNAPKRIGVQPWFWTGNESSSRVLFLFWRLLHTGAVEVLLTLVRSQRWPPAL